MAIIGINSYDHGLRKKSFDSKERKVTILKIKTTTTKQIVQTSESEDKKPLDKSFLSEKTNSFQRQTRARVVDKFNDAKTAGSSLTQKASKPSSRKKVASSNTKTLSSFGIGMPQVAVTKKLETSKSSSTEDQLLREVSSMAAANNDYVTDIPLADVTRFNTVEYRHYGFYQRIRNQLELHWGSSLKDKAKRIYKTGRKIASDNDFITNLEVFLDTSGKITGMKIIGTSGVKELDDAAIESFNKAGPFPNPPKDLISNGTAVIKWGFVVKS